MYLKVHVGDLSAAELSTILTEQGCARAARGLELVGAYHVACIPNAMALGAVEATLQRLDVRCERSNTKPC